MRHYVRNHVTVSEEAMEAEPGEMTGEMTSEINITDTIFFFPRSVSVSPGMAGSL